MPGFSKEMAASLKLSSIYDHVNDGYGSYTFEDVSSPDIGNHF